MFRLFGFYLHFLAKCLMVESILKWNLGSKDFISYEKHPNFLCLNVLFYKMCFLPSQKWLYFWEIKIIKGRITSSIFQGSCDIRTRKGPIIRAGNTVSRIPYGVRRILLVVSCIWELFRCDLGHIASHFRILFLKSFRQFQKHLFYAIISPNPFLLL